MLAPDCFGGRAAPLIPAAYEEDIEALSLLLNHVFRELVFALPWILDAQLPGARKLVRPRLEDFPVLFALESGGHA